MEDGAILQMGIGAVPDEVLAALKDHRWLGVHTEMWSDGLLPLLECGAVDNSRKIVHPGRTVSGFVVGTRPVWRPGGLHPWRDDIEGQKADHCPAEPDPKGCSAHRANPLAGGRGGDDAGPRAVRVTENGAVELYRKTLNERTELLISIAHPDDDQERLERAWHEARA